MAFWGRTINSTFKTFFFGLIRKHPDMSSSYVEVRETENGTESEVLPYEIEQCDSNGLEIQPQVDGEPPKDHTYNKDPVIDLERVDDDLPASQEQISENNADSENNSKKSARSSRNTKIAKPRNTEKSPVKAEKKNARKKATAVDKVPEKVQEKKNESVDVEECVAEDAVQNTASEVNSPKRRGQKRKVEEVESVKDEKSPKKVAEASVKKDKNSDSESPKEEKTPKSPKKEKSPTKKKEKSATPKTPKKEVIKTPAKGKISDDKVQTSEEAGLPEGWTRKIVERKSGKTAGLFDIYIYSPEGVKFRSRPDIAAYLARTKSDLKVEDFNFTKRGLTPSKAEPKKEKEKVQKDKISDKPEKSPSKAQKKASSSTSKKGQKLVVKLNFTTPKKRILSDYESEKKPEKKGKARIKYTSPKASTSDASKKQSSGNKRKKAA